MLMAELRASHQVNPQCQEKCIPMNSYDKAKQGGLEFMRSNNHEYFLDKNQTPLSNNQQESSILFSSQKTIMDYVTLKGIENRTGVGKENLYGFILKELLDNALDFSEARSVNGKSKGAEVILTITKDDTVLSIAVRNSNDSGKAPFSREKLESIFNSDIFYSSKRNQYKITRGALGDAFKEILCIPYALARKYNNNTAEWEQPLIITTKIDNILQTFLVSLRIDRINQTIHREIQESNTKDDNETKSNYTEVKVHLPLVEEVLDLNKLSSFLIDYAAINTHISFTFNLPVSASSSELNLQQNTISFPRVQHINTNWTNISSIYYYSLSEFHNFIFGLDKSNDDLPIYNILQKTFREGSNMKKAGLTEMSVAQIRRTPHSIDQLYMLLRDTMKPISSPSNLSLPFDTNKRVRVEAIKKRLEQRASFKVFDIKYKSQYGYHKSKDSNNKNNSIEFPYYFEIAIVSSNSIPYYLDFAGSLNSSVMPGNYSFLIGPNNETFYWQTQSDKKNGKHHKSRSIFDILEYYGYSHNKDKCKKPHTLVIANLISPRIDYKSYGKSNIDLSPFAEIIAETSVKASSGGGGVGGSSLGKDSISVIGLLRRLLKERFEAVKQDTTLKEKQKWTQSTVFYHLRPVLLQYGFSPESIDRQYITSKIKNVCEQDLGAKREDLGITAADRAQLYFKGQWYDVGLEEINDLVQFGTDMVIIEKEGVVKQLAPFADEKGIALLNTRGFLTEYASILSEQASKYGCNIAILTDFDASGLLIANNIPDVYRIGIDLDTLDYFNLSPSQVEEKYKPKQNHLKPLQQMSFNQTAKYVSNKRIEIDSVMAAVNNNYAFFKFILSKIENKFPTRDYNRAIDIPEYVMPSCLEVLNKQVREKCIPILQNEREKLKGQFSNTKGFLNIRQYNISIPNLFRKEIEGNKKIKPLLSDIESLNLKSSLIDYFE
jgi:hypothetical protein